MDPQGWADSDYAENSDNRKSTTWYVFKLGPGLKSWSSKKQPIMNLPSTEDKLFIVAWCGCGYNKTCDNNSTIKLSKNIGMHGICKHMDVRFHFLRDLTKDGKIETSHCITEEQLADVLTMPLKPKSLWYIMAMLGVCVAWVV